MFQYRLSFITSLKLPAFTITHYMQWINVFRWAGKFRLLQISSFISLTRYSSKIFHSRHALIGQKFPGNKLPLRCIWYSLFWASSWGDIDYFEYSLYYIFILFVICFIGMFSLFFMRFLSFIGWVIFMIYYIFYYRIISQPLPASPDHRAHLFSKPPRLGFSFFISFRKPLWFDARVLMLRQLWWIAISSFACNIIVDISHLFWVT